MINKTVIRKARQEELQKLGTILRESKAIRNLKENKSQKEISGIYLSEVNRLIGRYASLLLLEFIEAKVAEAGKALHVIMNANNDNELGRYLNSLEIMKKVPGKAHRGKVDVFTRIGEIGEQESSPSRPEVNRPVHAGYSTRLSPSNLGPGAGSFKAVEEAIVEGIFDKLFGKKEKEQEYKPTPTKLANAAGEVVGSFEKPKQTLRDNPAGDVARLGKEREELTNLVLRDEPKIVELAIAYVRFFDEERLKDPVQQKKLMKAGFFGSGLESLVKKHFGKVKGFDTKKFVMEMTKNPDLIQTNLQLTNRYSGVLMGIDEVMQGIVSGMKKGIASTAGEFLTGMGGGGFKTMFEGGEE